MSEAYDEFYLNLIKKAEDQELESCGRGDYKNAYSLDGHIILKSFDEYYKPAKSITQATALKNYGVNIALPKFFTSKQKAIDGGNKLIFYQIQEEAKGSFPRVARERSLYSHIIAFNPQLKNEQINLKKLEEIYNLEMAKHRAKTGLPHLFKSIEDYLTLSLLGFRDIHHENVYYSSTNGYTYFDLYSDMDFDSDNIKRILESQAELTNRHSHIYSLNPLRNFLDYCFGIDNFELSPHVNSHNFPQLAYNSILTYQFIETLKAHAPKNAFYNPLFPYIRGIAQDFEEDFESMICCDTFSMHPKYLLLLEEGLINNDKKTLDRVRVKYDLGEKFDFSCIDIPNFLETMRLTHEFDFANPTNNQAPTSSTVDHIKVSTIDENNFDFEMV